MTKLIVLPSIGLVTAGGGLVGSNYVFKKTIIVDLEQNGSNEQWDLKLSLLIPKLTSDTQLGAKINSGAGSVNNLAINSATPKDFTQKDNARTDLKNWCKKTNKEAHEKAHEDELCKESKQVNWLF